ncbi:inosine triphosphate pyrophosphatase-like protein [Calycina marina]|uniref:inosine/xanthosine triphosphatase n=1 Tax=Calycina marina TaxID=1763456 RepID=A0A9P7Z9G9_9HELO|nr:inosine triphosphate pyrophosphatase-like protein [Calycina marina]
MTSTTPQDAAPKRIAVASRNPVKIGAALTGFQSMFQSQRFTAEGITVPSGVAEQPFTDSETLQGGVENTPDQVAGSLQSFAWVVVIGEAGGRIGKARTAMFYQPEVVAKLVREGMELGHADDKVFGRSNSKQQNGSVGLLTGDMIGRKAYYLQAVILALIPFKNEQLAF